MPLTSAELRQLGHRRFDALPAPARARVFGVDYAWQSLPCGGDLLLTQHGWPWRDHLNPVNWYAEEALSDRGERLTRSTGTVYRITINMAARALTIVAKISRVAQHLDTSALQDCPWPGSMPAFNDPFLEVALVERLRRSRRGPPVRTKRPLCVFVPARRYELWQLGRDPARFRAQAERVLRDQEPHGAGEPVRLVLQRDYVLVYGWIEALTLPDLVCRGVIGEAQMRQIREDVLMDLARHRFTVLDHKPDHIIVRPRSGGALPMRAGRLVYALADYELLVDLESGPVSASHEGAGAGSVLD